MPSTRHTPADEPSPRNARIHAAALIAQAHMQVIAATQALGENGDVDDFCALAGVRVAAEEALDDLMAQFEVANIARALDEIVTQSINAGRRAPDLEGILRAMVDVRDAARDEVG